MWRFLRGDRGQSVIELALAAPILIFALVAGVDLLRVGAVQQAVANAARVGAEYAGAHPQAAPSVVQAKIWSELSTTPGLDAGAGPTVATCASPASPPYKPACALIPSQAGSPATFQGTTFAGGSCESSLAGATCYLQVEVRYTFATIINWPLVPNQITIDRTVQMPILR